MKFTYIPITRRKTLSSELNYLVKAAQRAKDSKSVTMAIRADVVAKLKWQDGEKLRLQLADDKKHARLVAHANGDIRCIQPREQCKGRQWRIQFSWAGEVAEMFTWFDRRVELTVIEISASEGITFELPAKEGDEV
jgi:hypothetical protein